MAAKAAAATKPVAATPAARTCQCAPASSRAGQGEPEGRQDHRDGGIDRDRIAGGAPPLRGTDADEECRRDAPGAPDAIAGESPARIGREPVVRTGCERPGSTRREDETQRHGDAGQHDIGQPFEADRHREAGQDAGRGRGPALAVAPRHRRDQQHGDGDLDVVMVDPPGNEMLEGRQPHRGEHQRNRRRVPSGDPPGDRRRAGHGRHQPQHRPHRAHQALGEGGIGELPEQPQHSRQPGVDQPRPMGIVAVRRPEPRFMQVEPAMAVDETPHLDEAHGVVHVGQGQCRVRPVIRQELQDDNQPCEAQEQGNVRHGRTLGQGITFKLKPAFPISVATCVSLNSAATIRARRAAGAPGSRTATDGSKYDGAAEG